MREFNARLSGVQTMDIATLGLEIRSDGVVVAKNRLRDFEGQADRTEKRAAAMGAVIGRAFAALGAALSIRELASYADAWSDMQSRIGAAIKDMDAAPAMMQRMVDLANASYSPLNQTVEVYSRNVGVLRDLGYSASQAADFTEALNHSLVITATRGERAASVQNALAKAMAVGKLQADGLETVLANGGRVAEALADELDTTVSGLRKMASEGRITGDVIARSLTGRLGDLREEAAKMPATIADAFTRIQTNLTAMIGTFDKTHEISGRVAEAIRQPELSCAYRGCCSDRADRLDDSGDRVCHMVFWLVDGGDPRQPLRAGRASRWRTRWHHNLSEPATGPCCSGSADPR
jgi:tape measure domain-containing protein